MSIIPLAKPFDPTKFKGRVLLSEKLDGVPVRYDFYLAGPRPAQSRQGHILTSIDHIEDALIERWKMIGEKEAGKLNAVIVGEITHPEIKNFKDLSGLVRRDSPCPELVLNVFDGYLTDPEDGFLTRIADLSKWLGTTGTVRVVPQRLLPITITSDKLADTAEEHMRILRKVQGYRPEGVVFRDAAAPFKPGMRHWDYQKYVVDPTIELRLHSVVEGKGSHAGSVGRMNFWYKGEIIGVGPGKLTHAERRIMWQSWKNSPFAAYSRGSGPIATIQYKRDDSYDALRQPTFQHWRNDKDTADA